MESKTFLRQNLFHRIVSRRFFPFVSASRLKFMLANIRREGKNGRRKIVEQNDFFLDRRAQSFIEYIESAIDFYVTRLVINRCFVTYVPHYLVGLSWQFTLRYMDYAK